MAGERILCVDDEESARAMLEAHLAGLGYRVTTAADGREALRRIGAEPPHLVITDLQMPHLDGAGLCHRLRADPAAAHLPVLVVSGHPRIAQVAREAGADAWLSKPVTPEALARSVVRLLSRASSRIADPGVSRP